MSLEAAAWCIVCGAAPTVAVTVERRGALMHYGSCWAHVAEVAARAQGDTARIDDEDRRRALGAAYRILDEADPVGELEP